MNKEISFLTGRISKEVLKSKLEGNYIPKAFITEGSFADVPEEAGIYIMLSDDVEFIYPKGTSKVFYIGTSNNLKKRLLSHNRRYKDAVKSFNSCDDWIYSRYNYAYKFGANIYYMRITGRESEKGLESKAIESFYDKYGALPVGNGAFSFR